MSKNDDYQIFQKFSGIKKHTKRTSLFLQGDKADKFFIILKGVVKLYVVTDDGEEIIIDMLGAGDVLGNEIISNVPVYSFSAITVDETEVNEIPHDFLKKMMKENHEFALKIMTIMNQRVHQLQIENSHLLSMKTVQRLGCLLLRLSSWMQGKGGVFTLPYDKSIIAAQLGMNPATLSRMFTKLESKGVSKNGHEISIQDFTALSKCCCLHCPLSEHLCAGRHIPKK